MKNNFKEEKEKLIKINLTDKKLNLNCLKI